MLEKPLRSSSCTASPPKSLIQAQNTRKFICPQTLVSLCQFASWIPSSWSGLQSPVSCSSTGSNVGRKGRTLFPNPSGSTLQRLQQWSKTSPYTHGLTAKDVTILADVDQAATMCRCPQEAKNTVLCRCGEAGCMEGRTGRPLTRADGGHRLKATLAFPSTTLEHWLGWRVAPQPSGEFLGHAL